MLSEVLCQEVLCYSILYGKPQLGNTGNQISRKTFYTCDLALGGGGKLTQTWLSSYFKTTSENKKVTTFVFPTATMGQHDDNEQRAGINSDVS